MRYITIRKESYYLVQLFEKLKEKYKSLRLENKYLMGYMGEIGKIILEKDFIVVYHCEEVLRETIRLLIEERRKVSSKSKEIMKLKIQEAISKYKININSNLLNSLISILEQYDCSGHDVFVIPKNYNFFQKPFYFVEIKATSKEMTPQLTHNQKKFVKDCIRRGIGIFILSLIILYNKK